MSTFFNVAEVTAALVEQIKNHPGCIGVFSDVQRGEYINKEPGLTPWCGIYRESVSFEPWSLGNHSRSLKCTVVVNLVIQASGKDGPDTEDKLEDAISRVMKALQSDLTVRNTVDMIKLSSILYSYEETKSESIDFQWAFLTLNLETRTGVNSQ